MKRIAILFTAFILLVIVLADTGILSRYLAFMYRVPYADKLGHFILYGILALLLNMAFFRSRPDQNRWRLAFRTVFGLALLIGLEEFSQQYFANRTFDLVDLSFSYLGVLCFSWVAVKTKK